jgi:NTP pyrophosphatase (non-canonical NTP hydrolase)
VSDFDVRAPGANFRLYFERTPTGSCPDPSMTPVRLVSEGNHPNGCSRTFSYFTREQAADMEKSLASALPRSDDDPCALNGRHVGAFTCHGDSVSCQRCGMHWHSVAACKPPARPAPDLGAADAPPLAIKVAAEVLAERARQEAKWGEQNHDPFVYGAVLGEELGEFLQAALKARFESASVEASELRMDDLRKEAVQCAAVALAIVECIDRNKWTWGGHALPRAASL